MTIEIEISDKNKEQIINAISLLKGVKICKKPKRIFKEVKESKADHKAWLKAKACKISYRQRRQGRGDIAQDEQYHRKAWS